MYHFFIGCIFSSRSFQMVKVRPTKGDVSKGVTKELSISGLTLRLFATGLVSATVADVTKPWVAQLVDVVGAAVLYLNEK